MLRDDVGRRDASRGVPREFPAQYLPLEVPRGFRREHPLNTTRAPARALMGYRLLGI